MENKIKWSFTFDHKNYKHEGIDGKLVAFLNTGKVWFAPDTYVWISLPTFINHVRKLARYYNADNVIVSKLETIDQDFYCVFGRRYLFKEKYLENTDQSKKNVYYDFWKKPKIPQYNVIDLNYYWLYESEIFLPHIIDLPLKQIEIKEKI